MLKENWQETVKELHGQAVENHWLIDLYWQDHFYNSRGQFGYPTCAALYDPDARERMEVRIIGWSVYESTCGALLELVDQFVDDLDRETKYDTSRKSRKP